METSTNNTSQGQSAPELIEETIEEQLDRLSQEFMATGFDFINRLKSGKKIDKEEEVAHIEMGKHLKTLQQTYNFMIRMGRVKPTSKPNEEFDKGVMNALKKKQGSIGAVTMDIPKNTNNNGVQN